MTKKVFLVMGFVLIPYVTASLIEQGTHDQPAAAEREILPTIYWERNIIFSVWNSYYITFGSIKCFR